MIRGRRSRLAPFVLALLVAGQPALAPAQLPSLGEGSELGLSAERRIGDRVVRELYRDPDYIDDPVLFEYVMGIWQPLLAAARQRGDLNPELDQRFAWQVLLGKDRSINAFALPGGWLGLHLGLIAASGTRDELAAVLAHELSHVTQRHISRLMTRQKQQAPWMIGAMILSALAASKSPEASRAVAAGGQALVMQNQLTFSRDMEREADRIGLGVMTQAGFQAEGLTAMFEKLQQSSRLNDSGSDSYLRTHPLTTERLADMQSRQVLGASAQALKPDMAHALMAARARVLSAGSAEAMNAVLKDAQLLPPDASRQRQASALYGGALAAAKLGDMPAAERLLASLKPLVAGDNAGARAAKLLSAELALMGGQADIALKLPTSASGSRPELLMAAQSALRSGRASEAAQALQTWVTEHPGDGTAWQLLAKAHAAQGQTLRAIRADAEAQVAWFDYAAAMDRLRAAQDVARRGAGDHIEASIVDTRIKQVESLLKEQALER